ncbi:hypothetical protein [Phyllobacterium sp. K27]
MNKDSEQSDVDQPHLTAEEVVQILQFVASSKPILVGGQAISIWATMLGTDDEQLEALGPVTSVDVDFFHNKKAQKALVEGLEKGELRLPDGDDHTPSAAVVTGYIGEKKIVIDFMSAIKGVSDSSLYKNSMTIMDTEGTNPVSINLMGPLDCVKSRLANINELKRTSDHSIRQAMASLRILDLYLESELGFNTKPAVKTVTEILQQLEYVAVNQHIGKISHLEFGKELDLVAILQPRMSDERLDERWREKILRPILSRISEKILISESRTIQRKRIFEKKNK